MAVSTGSQIEATDYDAIRDRVAALLGVGSARSGYGQTVISNDVARGDNITKAQWDAVRYDLLSILYHQNGTLPNLVTVNVGDPIRVGAGNPVTDYALATTVAENNKFVCATSQSAVTTKATANYTNSWNTQAQATLTVTFSNSNVARYFFNSGGRIRLTSSRSGGSNTAQNTSWTALLNAVGTQALGVDTALGFYSLTNSYQIMYDYISTLYYGGNYYKIEAKCDVANNSTGTATQLTFKVTWADTFTDRYVPPLQPDNVNGTLSLLIEELKAVGNLFPSGTFTISSPSYSLSPITAS